MWKEKAIILVHILLWQHLKDTGGEKAKLNFILTEMKNILQYVAREQRTILVGHGVLLTR